MTTDIEQTQAQLWEASKRLPLVPCPGCPGCGHYPAEPLKDPRYVCYGSGTVPSDLAKAVQMAMTVPVDGRPYGGGIEHVLRPAPGEVPCPCMVVAASAKMCEACRFIRGHDDSCYLCGGSGTVPGTDEASVVARWEGCGRLGPVSKALWDTDPGPAGDDAFVHLCQKLEEGDYLGALQAATAAVEVVAAQEART